jgi:hypothetical protein
MAFIGANDSVKEVEVYLHLPPANNNVHGGGDNILIPPALHPRAMASRFTFASHTWHSSLTSEPNDKDLARLTTHFKALEAAVCDNNQRLIRVIPSLKVLIVEDLQTKRRFEMPAETLAADSEEAYFRFKTAFFRKYPGSPAYESQFREGEHFNVAGTMLKPRISANPSPRAFISQHLPTLLEGRTDKEKTEILARIGLIDIYIGKKTISYKQLIANVQRKIEQTDDEEEKQSLQNDLAALQKRYNELQEIDPNALYWLAVFHDKDDLEKGAEPLQKAVKAATGNERLATELAMVLVDSRVAQHDFCARNGVGVKNTELLYTALSQIVDRDIAEETDEYETGFVWGEIVALNKSIKEQVSSFQERLDSPQLTLAQKTDPRYFMESILQENKLSALTFNQKFLPQLISAEQGRDIQKQLAERVAVAEKLLDRKVQYAAIGLEEEAKALDFDPMVIYWLIPYYSGEEHIEVNAQMIERDATRILKDPAYAKMLANLLRARYAREFIEEVVSIKADTDPELRGKQRARDYEEHKEEVLSIERDAYQSAVNILVSEQIPGYTVPDRVNGAAHRVI